MTPSVQRQRLGKMIVRYRKHAGLTQRQLALRMEVSRAAVAHWEQGKRWPDQAQLSKLIDECHLNLVELFPPAVTRARR